MRHGNASKTAIRVRFDIDLSSYSRAAPVGGARLEYDPPGMEKQVFPIIPASTSVLWVVVPVFALFLLVGGVLGWAVWASRNVRFEVSREGIRIAGDLYGRQIPLEVLEPGQARPVDLRQDGPLRLVARTNGTGLPGYAAGWFRTASGDKTLAFLTDRSHVAYIPTRDGYSLLVSVAEPERFIEQVRQAVAAGAGPAR